MHAWSSQATLGETRLHSSCILVAVISFNWAYLSLNMHPARRFTYFLNDEVYVLTKTGEWTSAVVRKIDNRQMQVQYESRNKKYQYWYHMDSEEVLPGRARVVAGTRQ